MYLTYSSISYPSSQSTKKIRHYKIHHFVSIFEFHSLFYDMCESYQKKKINFVAEELIFETFHGFSQDRRGIYNSVGNFSKWKFHRWVGMLIINFTSAGDVRMCEAMV